MKILKIIMLISLMGFLLSGCSNGPDGKMTDSQGSLSEPGCLVDDNCKNDENCENNECMVLECSSCEYTHNHICVEHLCCDDADCDDGDPATLDVCKYDPKTCMNTVPEECGENDGVCPPYCTQDDDADCNDDFYTYKDFGYEFEIRYPSDWTKKEIVASNQVYFESEDGLSGLFIEYVNLESNPMGLDAYSDAIFKMVEETMSLSEKNQSEMTIDGVKAKRKSYSTINGFTSYSFDAIAFKKGDDAYVIKSIQPNGEDTAVLDKMKDSFKFVEFDLDEEKITNPFLWKIKGASKDSYLFGTVHLSDERVTALPDCVIDAIRESDSVYTEIIMGMDSQMKILQSAMSPGIPLENRLGTNLYNKTAEYFLEHALSLDLFAQTKPWFIITLIGNMRSLSPQESMKTFQDMKVSSLAEEYEKEIGGLEKLDFQINLFENFTNDEQKKWLEASLDFADKYGKVTDLNSMMIEPYLSGNEEIILEYVDQEAEDYPVLDQKIKELLYVKRNVNMAEKIHEKISGDIERSYFFAVGVGHFPGDQGIIDLLEDKGLTIERVDRFSCES